jgi:hypothetical protein
VGSVFGQPNVEWGNFSRFLEYTHMLNWYLPAGMIPALGVIATGAESFFGLLLLVGWHTRAIALLSGLLLLSFGAAMTLALGIKAPLNFAVFTGWEEPSFSQLVILGQREPEMHKIVLVLLLAFSSVLAFSSMPASSSAHGQDRARGTRAGTVTRLMTRDLPDVPGKEVSLCMC